MELTNFEILLLLMFSGAVKGTQIIKIIITNFIRSNFRKKMFYKPLYGLICVELVQLQIAKNPYTF